MHVDSGYLLASFYSEILKNKFCGEICFSNELFSNLLKYLKIDLSKECICFVIKVKDLNFQDSLKKLTRICKYQIFKDWDTQSLDLYKTIEEIALNQEYNIKEEIVGEDKILIFSSKLFDI